MYLTWFRLIIRTVIRRKAEGPWWTGMLDNCANMCGREDGDINSSQHWLTREAYKELQAGLDPECNLDHRVNFLWSINLHRMTREKDPVQATNTFLGV